MVKDIIISHRMNNNHYSILTFKRVISDESTKALGFRALNEWTEKGDDTVPMYDQIMSLIQNLSDENYERTIPALNYLGIYIDVLDRPDLSDESIDTTISYPVRVYLINPDQSAIAIASEDPTASAVATAVMNIYISKLAIDPRAADILRLDFDINEYNSLSESGSASEFDYSKFYNLVTSGNKTLKIFVGE